MAHKNYASKEVFCGIKFQTNMKIWILSKNSGVKSNNGILVPVPAKGIAIRFCWWCWVHLSGLFGFCTSWNYQKISISNGLRGGVELNWFAWTHLILDAKYGNGFSNLIVYFFILLVKKFFNSVETNLQ